VGVPHPLLDAGMVREVEEAASAHRGRPWRALGFTDLEERASHPCGIFSGEPFSVFVKLYAELNGLEQVAAEVAGLRFIHDVSDVATPVPVGDGVVATPAGSMLLSEALPERGAGPGLPGECRTASDYADIGHALARLHQVTGGVQGMPALDGFFGPFRLDNRPVASGRWADFYAERRLLPALRLARDAGQVTPKLAAAVERVAGRLPRLCGPEPAPTLLHGDAQQNNFVSTADGAYLIDACPYFGHPEVDLALAGYFRPVPQDLFDAYRGSAPIDAGFPERQELWRMHAYLAVAVVAGGTPCATEMLDRLAAATRQYS
jgi:fructosamine-3-kinase